MLSDQENSVIKKFKTILEQTFGKQFIELRLFGSKARGDDHPDSDIDVLVIVETDDWHIRDKVYDIVTDMLLEMDVCISPKVISKSIFAQLCKEGASFIHNISKDAITLI